MSEKLFKTIKSLLLECDKLPERVIEILNTTKNSLNDLEEIDSKQLWSLMHDFIKETSIAEDIAKDNELLACYQSVLNLVQHAINSAVDISVYEENEHLIKTILIFQTLYSKQLKYKFKLEIAKMCSSFWKLFGNALQNRPGVSFDFDSTLANNFIFTFNYLFETIKVTTKKLEMKMLSTLLWELCKVGSTFTSNKNIMSLIVSNLEKSMKYTLFLETETGKLTLAEVFGTNQQLFQKFHQNVKKFLPKTSKSEAEAYGEIYFMAWINSSLPMKEIIEQQGIFDLISKTLTLQRVGPTFRTYRSALILLQSLQNHRKHLMFSKVMTKLYTPVIWRQLSSEFKVVRCNATEILARAYPLEKRGEGREVSSRYLIKQQDAFLDLLVDSCPQVRIAAIKGICSCMRYFWNSFEDDQLNKFFSLFTRLISERVFEVRRVVYYGFCQLLEERKSHDYFCTPLLRAKLKNALNDDNEKVRRAFIHLLLKIKKIDSQALTVTKINYAKIVNLHDIAHALAREDKPNGLLLVDLIFDNFIGNIVPDRHATLMRINMFYKINPTGCRKLMLYSEKNLDFDHACKLILSLLKTVYNGLVNKEARLKDKDKENNIPAKKRKTNNDSDNISDISSSCSSSNSNNEDNEQTEHTNVCCILDCVNCLMILHRNAFIDENNHQQMKEIQDSCTSCLIKILKFYKEGDAYFSAMNLASLIPASKLTAHVSVTSAALSTLKLLPYDIKYAEEEVDIRKVNCLVYSLCMWKRGYEIIQLVNIWFDEAFKTLNLNDSQYPETKIKEGKRVRFKTVIEECKPMTGILLINSMLTNLQTQETLMNTDVNKKNVCDLILYLQRIKPSIENRITSDSNLSDLLSDEVLADLFLLNMRLHVFYHSHKDNRDVDEINNYQTSILDWVTNNILSHDLHLKDEITVILTARIINIINYIIMHLCLMAFINNSFLDNYFAFCVTLLHNYLGPRVLISMTATLVKISKHFYHQKFVNDLKCNVSSITNCVCSIIAVLGESKYNEDRFKSIIGEPKNFRHELILVVLEVQKIDSMDFKQVFNTLIETLINIIANQIREIDEVDLMEKLTEMPFAACQLATIILNNAKLRKCFTSNAVEIFSSNIYKNDCVLLLSAISFIHTLSFQSKQIKANDLEPVVKHLYKILMDHDKTMTPLGNNCTVINKAHNDTSILETSDFSNNIIDFKQKGRNVLIATAKQLHIALTE